ncbi:mannose/cellobiose epimerase-like protein (N-acyl-D-glucosamine 2-epimerase family) [Isoptericola jiangsuensis]|uniref:Mannose/cellobiose epimerase-like protein (N-acyl-D-glucosamine 2-epimerase family) n=1 Tax=Isoptericola jiangsuensis TaxID=548579 RepID=A0A2A9F0B4_9MICO|nr:AGE family epimerase/isomerase [Isoptericola jiangsuensis]PFG43940.1 mannose/cellobiose epimerase-like protein (N-acyl-D-glucosamine 2-epimerase family) [Isoptericola jiangsuensis]
MTTPWTDLPTHRAWLDAECRRLLAFGRDVVHPAGGAAYLGDDGTPEPGRGVQTWITARTVHVYSLGAMLGVPGSATIARGALAGLTGVLRDAEHGGWFHAVAADGTPDTAAGKSCYDHAFVVLAASSATLAGLPGGRELLDEATGVLLDRFWDEDEGRCVDTWDAAFTTLDEYRGLNANMHAVEAMLAAADALDDPAWRGRAARIAELVAALAAGHDGRLPEHFGPDWTPQPDLNRDRPDDQFKPFGATVGHGLEWARLLVELEAALGDQADPALRPTAVALFDRAVTDGWSVDGADGFVYTTDWDGTPVVRDRMHWVAAEAVSAADALHRATGEERYAALYATWWDWVAVHLVDVAQGSWFHQLDARNRPAGDVWPGKPDLYHAVQATLLPRAPLAPALARAARDGLVAG